MGAWVGLSSRPSWLLRASRKGAADTAQKRNRTDHEANLAIPSRSAATAKRRFQRGLIPRRTGTLSEPGPVRFFSVLMIPNLAHLRFTRQKGIYKRRFEQTTWLISAFFRVRTCIADY
jgi:hypothetical protein